MCKHAQINFQHPEEHGIKSAQSGHLTHDVSVVFFEVVYHPPADQSAHLVSREQEPIIAGNNVSHSL